jgi:hypothetical protein
MARKCRFRFGLPVVFAGARLSAGSALAVSQAASIGALGSGLPDSVVGFTKPAADFPARA